MTESRYWRLRCSSDNGSLFWILAFSMQAQMAILPCLAESPAQAALPAEADRNFYAKLDSLNRKILLKDIELERFNINFRKANNVQGRWRGPRYFLATEGNACATGAGVLTAVIVREKSIRDPFYLALNSKGKIVKDRRFPFRIGIEDAIIPQFVGQCLGVFGSSVELGINHYHDREAHLKGFDPQRAILHVKEIKKNIGELFAERSKLLQDNSDRIPDSHLQLARGQGVVLDDLCQLALNEYRNFHIGARQFRGFQDSLYLFDIAKNASGAAGNIVAMYATEKKRSTANGPAGLLTSTSASLVIAGPIFSRLIGRGFGMYSQHKLRELVKPNEAADLERLQADRSKLAQLLQKAQDSDPIPDAFFTKTVEVDSLNELSTQAHRIKLTLASRELRAGTRAASQNILAGTIVGGSKLGPGIGLMIGGFHFWKHPIESNILICNGNLAYFCGTSLAVMDNARIQLRSELQRRKLAKNHLLPGQILGDHMKRLDEIEHQLALGSKNSGSQ